MLPFYLCKMEAKLGECTGHIFCQKCPLLSRFNKTSAQEMSVEQEMNPKIKKNGQWKHNATNQHVRQMPHMVCKWKLASLNHGHVQTPDSQKRLGNRQAI